MSSPDALALTQFSVDTFPETFARSTRGLVTGKISARLGDKSFPEAHWNDFVVVIIGWWLHEILKILTGTAASGHCRFMDGPYWFAIEVQSNDTVVVRCMEERQGTKCVLEALCTRDSVLRSMLSAAASVIRKCQEESWFSSDLESLVSAYETLRT